MTFKTEIKLFAGMIFLLWLTHFSIYNYFGPGLAGLFLFPVLLAFSLRVILTPIFAYHLVLVLFFVFNIISEVKFFFSQKVLSIQDFAFLNQASDVQDFLPWGSLIAIALALLTLFIPYKKWNLNLKMLPVPAMLVLGLFAYSSSINSTTATNAFLEKYADIRFNMFNLRDNVKGNGILLHLSQTLAMGGKPSKGNHNFYAQDRSSASIPTSTLKSLHGYDIFLVTCESCYFEDNKESPLHNDFVRLLNDGYKRTSMISPVYGGNTSEAEFELITGLPAMGLPGIKFQLYGSGFSEKAETFSGYAKESGYVSYYFHNTPRVHWNRDVAMAKFSFENLYFIEDMNYKKKDFWARDFYLYDKVLAQYEESIKSPAPVFNQLMTVFSHGAYKDTNGDGGVADYNQKVAVSMDDFFKFEKKILEMANKSKRKVVFFLVGDHKPSLNKAYYQNKTISADYYMSKTDAAAKNDFRFKESPDARGLQEMGRVPFFVKVASPDKSIAAEIIKPLQDKPLFCFPGYLANNLNLSKSRYFSRLKEVCDKNSTLALVTPEWQRTTFPPELFAEQLF